MTPERLSEIRVRMAPSPTGVLHVGTARTAIFNWLFAKAEGGTFVLRVEDTDKERSKKEYEEEIIENLNWLGIDWDEGPYKGGEYGPYHQSERTEIYKRYLQNLLKEHKVYYCFCTKEELENEREGQLAQGFAPKYSGKCRALSETEVKEKRHSGASSVIRFKTPEIAITFHDLIRGDIKNDLALAGDFVIARDEESPLYNFTVVIDDYEMKISHVLRGEDHIANTAKQYALQKELGFPHPKYAHLPLILDKRRAKLSKRDAVVGIEEYKNMGYLPEALFNFLTLLGWHPTDDKEMMTIEELIMRFDITKVQKGGAIFNTEKLDWLNGQYIKNMGSRELLNYIKEYVNIKDDFSEKELIKIVDLVKERMRKITDFKEHTHFFWELPEYEGKMLIWKATGKARTLENLNYVIETLKNVQKADFTRNEIEKIVGVIADERGRGEVLWPIRAALSGLKTSPGPYEIMDILGKEEAIKRLKKAVVRLETE
ncbi:MAG: glutamate--tRNA ligase [Candidatus Harrisonbacteria bacterium CG10_big_fil_rev_8_21_14_0_10_42_17]|uniref:Glutamate--tRNA ligase n=1 Tax=Candidatus Harrisonbacteria bacterium CG10_big_fil_rev_8_21_14_0_10_42_17 TaxID=1974584 RepID=A0A2M6WHQ0_9BACT|nr:MAG: glutamate--tRNA ligase [Candidatus Harrisonbacteria bacterium CG10_big_fil_rev_8_21_14_0_10_42_17]